VWYTVSIELFVGRKYELEFLTKYLKPAPAPTRSVGFIVGPSGIGKTALVRKTLSIIEDNIITLYLPLVRSYRDGLDALKHLASMLSEELSRYKGLLSKFREILLRVIKGFEAKIGPITIGSIVYDRETTPLVVFQDLLEELNNDLLKSDLHAVVVVDELQNMLTGEWSPWSLVKFFSMLQEYGRLRVVLVSSDYVFVKKIMDRVPSSYIQIFYLGEMSWEDSIELSLELTRLYDVVVDRESVEEAIELIGGYPSMIYDLFYQASLYGDFKRELERIRDKALMDVYSALNYLVSNGIIDYREVYKLLNELSTNPIYIKDIIGKPSITRAIEYLVSKNILQYGCRDFLGVYKWNKDVTGGLCSLELVAPPSRLYLNVLKDIVKEL